MSDARLEELRNKANDLRYDDPCGWRLNLLELLDYINLLYLEREELRRERDFAVSGNVQMQEVIMKQGEEVTRLRQIRGIVVDCANSIDELKAKCDWENGDDIAYAVKKYVIAEILKRIDAKSGPQDEAGGKCE